MKGLELAREYFDEYGRPLIENELEEYKEYIAAGLVGEGSECLGFDDGISHDHDFGPGFCIWVPDEIYRTSGSRMQEAYDKLPAGYKGYVRIQSAMGGGRTGVLPLETFYRRFTGLTHAPEDAMEWFRIPESFLATVTNGAVFIDNYGEFTRIRSVLRSFYPDDVLKKKLAARCAVIAQSGQYNYPRCMKRGDSQAAYLACSEFVKKAMSAVYLLNGSYMPYYKWMFRGAEKFDILSDAVTMLRDITLIPDTPENGGRKTDIIENISICIGKELNRRGFTHTGEAFLQAHGDQLMESIGDERLRNLHIMVDFE